MLWTIFNPFCLLFLAFIHNQWMNTEIQWKVKIFIYFSEVNWIKISFQKIWIVTEKY